MKNMVLVVAFFFLLIGNSFGAGMVAPDFTLNDLNGNPHSLKAYIGKVVLLEFFASWCPGCQKEVNVLKQVNSSFSPAAFKLISISNREPVQAVQTFVEKYNINYLTLPNEDGSIGRLYRIQAVPTMFLIDKKGMIRNVIDETATSCEILEKINKLLVEEEENSDF